MLLFYFTISIMSFEML